jgi:AmiR/NasT family two-component response regulator
LARVVIAEDEAIIRLDLKEILTSAGYDVVGESGRGDEAVELVAEHQPDLVILDIKMPGMDGIQAAREITSQHQVAVMLLTAFSQRDLIEEARDAGVAAYLVKPFQARELLPAVADVLSRARQEWALAAEDPTSPRRGGGQDRHPPWSTRPRRPHGRGDCPRTRRSAFIQQTAMQNRARMRDVAQQIVDGTLSP